MPSMKVQREQLWFLDTLVGRAPARSELPPSSGAPTPEQAEALRVGCLEHGIELVGPPLH